MGINLKYCFATAILDLFRKKQFWSHVPHKIKWGCTCSIEINLEINRRLTNWSRVTLSIILTTILDNDEDLRRTVLKLFVSECYTETINKILLKECFLCFIINENKPMSKRLAPQTDNIWNLKPEKKNLHSANFTFFFPVSTQKK